MSRDAPRTPSRRMRELLGLALGMIGGVLLAAGVGLTMGGDGLAPLFGGVALLVAAAVLARSARSGR